ncbi:DUF4271 domain-containing protein [Epilithonimonas arachidiradicis]|uniref:Uncharacterized protein DUF4271 n=1 Tax=Epilithonimonas arachidiradicis TaxID=1617282 RepID=A0A420DE52_9FLAO|nr:DUF4271 domain-containing protein [Epilithonimonas arachidiradicis]RKE89829.1 uncharacterized protein DUF4271 [Epilithonimonas arachidiradicis]
MIRITENNDWVVYCILGSIFTYVILLSVFQRDANIKDFLTQKIEDSNNITPSWVIISIVRCVMISLLLSQFVPIVPKTFSDIQLFGFQINKFGFTFLTLAIFDLVKNILTFFFYSSIGSGKNLKGLALVASKFFFLESIAVIIAGFVLYFYPVDLVKYFYFIIGLVVGSFVLKNSIYIFHNQPILPEKWYYKFLYICTLQIVPVLVLWKFLFY